MNKHKTAEALRLQIQALVSLNDSLQIKAAEEEIERLIGLLEAEESESPFGLTSAR